MGCGSVLGDLFYLADSLLDREAANGWRVNNEAAYSVRHTPPEGLRARLYRMYGDGKLSEEVFTALRTLAERGQLRPADLAVHRARAGQRPAERDDPSTANALRGVRSRLAQLAQARAASEKVLADLEIRLSDIDQRVAGKEQVAREIIASDEGSARQRLAEKVELAGSRDRLAAQARALREDLNRLDDLRAQLEAKAMELEALQARGRLNEEMLK